MTPVPALRRARLVRPATAGLIAGLLLVLVIRTVAAFAGRLQGAVDLDSVRTDLTAAVTGSLEPAHLSVWLSGGPP
jgi:hypothetical protein